MHTTPEQQTLTLQFAGDPCPLQFLLVMPYIVRSPHQIVIHSTALHEPDTVVIVATAPDADGWLRGLAAALQDAWVAWSPPADAPRRVPVRLVGAKVDVHAMQQTAPYDGPTQTPT